MTSKHKPVSFDTKLQALDEVDKKSEIRDQAHICFFGNRHNKTGLFSPMVAHVSVTNI